MAVAAAVGAVLACFLLSAVGAVLALNARLAARESDEAAAAGLRDRLEIDSDSAWAIFTPPADVFGQSNTDGHEVDFFARDAHSRPYFWAYEYSSAAQTVQRYLYANPGDPAVPDGPPVGGVTAFSAQTFPLTALSDPSAPLYSALYAGVRLAPATVRFGFPGADWIAGGNQLTYVRARWAGTADALVLATQTAPTGFTVVVRYTPSPAPGASPAAPATPAPTALIEVPRISGHDVFCTRPQTYCDNADWPEYYWTQITVYRSYRSDDGGYTWTLASTSETTNQGISTPTGGDVPSSDCTAGQPASYTYDCSATWLPQPPPGSAGLDFSPPT